MRIGIFLPSLHGGGAQRAMLRLAGGLSERGAAVDLVLGSTRGPLRDEIPDNIRVHDLGARRTSTAFTSLVRYLRQARPHALLTALTAANLVGILACQVSRTGTRLVVSERNTMSRVAATRGWKDRILARMAGFAYRRADAVVAVSKGVATDLVERTGLDPRKVTIIYNPVIGPELYQRAKDSVPNGVFDAAGPVLVAAGRLTPQKDFETLLRAFAIVRSQRAGSRLVLLGEGPEAKALRTLARSLDLTSNEFVMTGFIPNPYPYIRRADVFVLSSRYEGMPNVLIEAAALGTPVVSTDCESGPREVLGEHGGLVPVGDHAALARAILSQVDNARRVPPDALRPFTFDVAVDAYRRVLVGPQPLGSTAKRL